MSSDKDTFLQYGHSFQLKVIALLINDYDYLSSIYDIIETNYFDSDSSKWIVKDVQAYFEQYKTNPTWEAMVIRVKEIPQELLRTAVAMMLKDAYDLRASTDLQQVKDLSLKFCVNQEFVAALNDGVNLVQKGDYDGMRGRLDKAMKAGIKKDLGQKYKEALDLRMDESARRTIPTPWDVINDITDGGSSSGDLFVIVAPPGVGKTWGLVNVGAHALSLGKTVIHYSMELQESYVGRRYDAKLSGISAQNLKYHKDDIQSAIDAISGNLIIKYYPPKNASIQTLRSHIQSCILQGYKPDLVIVDYADLIKPMTGFKEIRHQLENIYEDLRSLAGEFGIPFWTASQANRSSADSEIIGGDKIAEAYSKLMVADFVISLSRRAQDKIGSSGRWHIIKNRFGPDGITFPSKMNTSTGLIQLFEESTPQGKQAKEDMKGGDITMRRILGQKYKDMKDEDKPPLDMREDLGDRLGGFEGGEDGEPTEPVAI